MNKVKDFLKKIKIDKALSFVKEHVRYFGAGATFVAIVLILAFGTNGVTSQKDPLAGAYQSYEENENEEIDKLIKSYYKNYSAGNVDKLKAIATPISDAEKSYIEFYSQYIEKYQKIKVYTKRGVDEDSYLCSVYLQLKFVDVDTPVAGLDFFYVQTNDKGKLYINNVYSAFNQANGEFDMDSEVSALIAAFEQQQDVLDLQAEVQKECNQALLSDENLNSFVNTNLQEAIATWAKEYKEAVEKQAEEAAAAKKAEEEEAKKKAEEAKKEEEAKKKEAEEKANATKKTANASVNVRDDASENGNKLGKLQDGQEVTCYSVENGWAKIEYQGQKAYVKAEFLDSAESSDEDTSEKQDEDSNDTEASLDGEEITLPNTVNVRESMSETADKICVAYAGEPMKVIQEYAEGWSKVEYKGKTGYCKTELLK